MPIKVMTPSKEQINELRQLFVEKYEKQPPAVPFHPVDIERIKNDDIWCTKFLEMYDLDIKTSFDKLWETCIFRQSYGSYDLSEKNLVKEYLNDGVIFSRNKDVDGKPLLIFRTKLHVKGAKNMDEVIRVVVYWIERIHRETNNDKMTLFFDMSNTGLGSMDLDLIKRIIETFKLWYPNALNYILIYEMAWVLNAAFKIIKSLLPPKALEILKVIGKKELNTYVDKDNCLAIWGGNDPYEYTFVPEQPPMKSIISAAKSNGKVPIEGSTTNTELLNGHDKKVHFANAESEMPECERGYSQNNTMTDNMLRISPSDNIYFKRGENSESVIELTCRSDFPIAYKIQTTAPEKFRVRPRCGYMQSGETVAVSIVLKQDCTLGEMTRDKFMVMCMPAPCGEGSMQTVSEAWKLKTSNSPDVEQHRLTCSYRVEDTPSHTSSFPPCPVASSAGGISSGVDINTRYQTMSANEVLQSAAKSAHSITELSAQAKMLESQLKFTQILQCVTLFFLLALSVAVVYLLRIQIGGGDSDMASPCYGGRQ